MNAAYNYSQPAFRRVLWITTAPPLLSSTCHTRVSQTFCYTQEHSKRFCSQIRVVQMAAPWVACGPLGINLQPLGSNPDAALPIFQCSRAWSPRGLCTTGGGEGHMPLMQPAQLGTHLMQPPAMPELNKLYSNFFLITWSMILLQKRGTGRFKKRDFQ